MGWTTIDVRRISRQGRLIEVDQLLFYLGSWVSFGGGQLSFSRSGTTSLVLKRVEYLGQ